MYPIVKTAPDQNDPVSDSQNGPISYSQNGPTIVSQNLCVYK